MDEITIELGREFLHARLGDERRSKRAARIVKSLAANPSLSFPRSFRTKAALEGFYRFVNNDQVSFDALSEAHADDTVARSEAEGVVLAIHDTTEFVLDPEVEGIGRLKGQTMGFLGHFALAASADGKRRPLGVLGMIPVVRDSKRRGKMTTAQLARMPPEEKESRRWPDLIDLVEGRLAGHSKVIHVADREADTYPLLSHLVANSLRFVVRISKDRTVEDATGELMRLRSSLEKADIVVE